MNVLAQANFLPFQKSVCGTGDQAATRGLSGQHKKLYDGGNGAGAGPTGRADTME